MYRVNNQTQRTAVQVPKDEVLTQLRRRLTLAQKRVTKWKDEIDNFPAREAERRVEQSKKDVAYLKALLKLVNAGKVTVDLGWEQVYRQGHVRSNLDLMVTDASVELPKRENPPGNGRGIQDVQYLMQQARHDAKTLKGAIRLIEISAGDTVEVLASDVGLDIMGTNVQFLPVEDDEDED